MKPFPQADIPGQESVDKAWAERSHANPLHTRVNSLMSCQVVEVFKRENLTAWEVWLDFPDIFSMGLSYSNTKVCRLLLLGAHWNGNAEALSGWDKGLMVFLLSIVITS